MLMVDLQPEETINAARVNHPAPLKGKYQVHPNWEMGVVLSGLYRRDYTGKTVTLERGGLWWHGPEEPHGWATLKPNTSSLVVEFTAPVLYSMPELKTGRPFIYLPFLRPGVREDLQPRTPAARERIARLAESIAAETGEKRPGWTEMVQLLFWQLLTETVRERTVANTPPAWGGKATGRILEAMEYINENLTKKISLSAAAQRACMGRTQFFRHFKQIMGITCAQYVSRRRLEGVHYDLGNGDVKLSAVARRWGFYDSGHMLKLYRKHFGEYPRRMRKAV
jgi:AraC-like DNA-binding protein